MIIRPVDENGDVLPVLSSSGLRSGAETAALLVRERLDLLTGDWWENPEKGNRITEMMKESRLTGSDLQAIGNYLSSYIRETNGVRDVRDAVFSLKGRRFHYACTVVTDGGMAGIQYSV